MVSRIRIGLLTPSSNTVMEPRVGALLADLPLVTAHFGRFRVTRIAMSDDALGQFTFEPQLQAADLLADAKCDVIAWGGTSGGWLGVENDRDLCRRITALTGVPATTSTLATLDGFRALGADTYGLATPYLDDVQQAICTNFAAAGFDCVAERHLGDPGNFSFATYDEDTVADLIREVARKGPGAIAVFCTNFDGTRVAPRVEKETGVPVLDSISVTMWHALRLAGMDTSALSGWGRIFECDLPTNDQRNGAPIPA
ncbi:aspartate/glutamate racemase family protein [Aestuariicoccus sp. MJ-SS9]|uniref:maleate cis-trans isomerase family protein n=1 Tax=Aestuariicoccus sp. MJ-SS9 TaxID=3079855 RepID=UPI00290F1610|nr:aspartate/glutamate racemase family protein [Aestuariicoccus sp. MJ-SS9]MDU8911657.1 aspartate/glutamate racemase family protein [Aestuariicoccus sp. MJ-SS9]